MQFLLYFLFIASTTFTKPPIFAQAAPLDVVQYDASIAIPNVGGFVSQYIPQAASHQNNEQGSHPVRGFTTPEAEAQGQAGSINLAITLKKHPVAFLMAFVAKFKNSYEWVKTTDGYKWMQRAGERITKALEAAWQWFQKTILRKPEVKVPPPPPPEPEFLTAPEDAAKYIKIAEDNMRIAEKATQEEQDARYEQTNYFVNQLGEPEWIPPHPSVNQEADRTYPNGKSLSAEGYAVKSEL